MGFSVIQLDFSVVNVTVKPIATALGGGVTGLRWVVFTSASAACGLVPAIWALIAARAVRGIGAAALGSCSLVLLNAAGRRSAHRRGWLAVDLLRQRAAGRGGLVAHDDGSA
ncbi:MAG TPA: hypothetical protein VF060_12345 [Trebonia sp.]